MSSIHIFNTNEQPPIVLISLFSQLKECLQSTQIARVSFYRSHCEPETSLDWKTEKNSDFFFAPNIILLSQLAFFIPRWKHRPQREDSKLRTYRVLRKSLKSFAQLSTGVNYIHSVGNFYPLLKYSEKVLPPQKVTNSRSDNLAFSSGPSTQHTRAQNLDCSYSETWSRGCGLLNKVFHWLTSLQEECWRFWKEHLPSSNTYLLHFTEWLPLNPDE